MIREYFEEKQQVIDLLRLIYNDLDHEKLLRDLGNTKYCGVALEMGLIDISFKRGYSDFDLVWTKKAHERFCQDC